MSEPVEGLILQQKWEDLTAYIFANVLRDLNKNDRFTLGSDLRVLIWDVQAQIVQVGLRYGNRWQQLTTIDTKAKVLLSMIRLGVKIGAIPEKRYNPISEKLVEIGKIVGGLMKKSRDRG